MDRLVCRECAKNYSLNEEIWRCSCGGLLDLDFQPFFPINRIRQRKPTLWRYREAIPIDQDQNVVTFEEGFTPLLPFERNGKIVWLKQDHLFPTGSYKDRGASVLISKAKELGIRTLEDAVQKIMGGVTRTMAVGLLVDQGKLEWDKPVREYMPNFKLFDNFATERMSPRDLLCHRSSWAKCVRRRNPRALASGTTR